MEHGTIEYWAAVGWVMTGRKLAHDAARLGKTRVIAEAEKWIKDAPSWVTDDTKETLRGFARRIDSVEGRDIVCDI